MSIVFGIICFFLLLGLLNVFLGTALGLFGLLLTVIQFLLMLPIWVYEQVTGKDVPHDWTSSIEKIGNIHPAHWLK